VGQRHRFKTCAGPSVAASPRHLPLRGRIKE
jgi:hypothetical protein